MKSRAVRCPQYCTINHTCQVDQESCQPFLACCHCFLNLSVFWSSECVWPCFWVSLPPFYPRWQHAPPQPTIKALVRSEVSSNTLATYCLRSHTSTPPPTLIFHWEEERDAYIILTEPEWRETSLRYLLTHMYCQRFIVQGFNGALTHLSLFVYLSPGSHRHTNTHPSIIQHSLPIFLQLSIFSLCCLSHICLRFSFLPSILFLHSPITVHCSSYWPINLSWEAFKYEICR